MKNRSSQGQNVKSTLFWSRSKILPFNAETIFEKLQIIVNIKNSLFFVLFIFRIIFNQ
jgi:hypothetical protein